VILEGWEDICVILKIIWRRILRINWRDPARIREASKLAVRRRDARKGKVWQSAFSSGNHVIRFAIEIPGSPDASGVAVQPWFDGQAPGDIPSRRAGSNRR
jgi:hypothetical protein